MPVRFRAHHRLECTPEVFWRTFFDHDFLQRLSVDGLGCWSVEVLEQTGSIEDGLRRRVQASHRVEAPGVVRWALRLDRVATSIEEGTFDAATQRYSFRGDLPVMPDRVSVSGEMWLERIGPATVRRVIDTTIRVKFLGVGPGIERVAEQMTRSVQDKTAEFTRRYLAAGVARD